MANSRSFNGKVALITGSSSGIGEGIAIHLASLGASVVITGRNEQRVKSVAEKCRSVTKGKVIEVIADLTIDDDVKRLIKTTIDECGKINILVNNAGVAKMDSIHDPNIMKSYSSVMNTNVRSVVLVTSLVVPYLEQTKGTIINISSIAGLRPSMTAIYSMAKCALDMFTKCLALELGPKGIRVNSINPGVIETPIFETMNLPFDMIDGMCKQMYPLKRAGKPMDIATAVEFLASDDASFITGTIIPVDGGGQYISTPRNDPKIDEMMEKMKNK